MDERTRLIEQIQELQAHGLVNQQVIALLLVSMPDVASKLRRILPAVEQELLGKALTDKQIEQARQLLSLYMQAAP